MPQNAKISIFPAYPYVIVGHFRYVLEIFKRLTWNNLSIIHSRDITHIHIHTHIRIHVKRLYHRPSYPMDVSDISIFLPSRTFYKYGADIANMYYGYPRTYLGYTSISIWCEGPISLWFHKKMLSWDFLQISHRYSNSRLIGYSVE